MPLLAIDGTLSGNTGLQPTLLGDVPIPAPDPADQGTILVQNSAGTAYVVANGILFPQSGLLNLQFAFSNGTTSYQREATGVGANDYTSGERVWDTGTNEGAFWGMSQIGGFGAFACGSTSDATNPNPTLGVGGKGLFSPTEARLTFKGSGFENNYIADATGLVLVADAGKAVSIGGLTSNLLGFFDSAPVAQVTGIPAIDAGVVNSGDPTTDDVINTMRDCVNALRTGLNSYGLCLVV